MEKAHHYFQEKLDVGFDDNVDVLYFNMAPIPDGRGHSIMSDPQQDPNHFDIGSESISNGNCTWIIQIRNHRDEYTWHIGVCEFDTTNDENAIRKLYTLSNKPQNLTTNEIKHKTKALSNHPYIGNSYDKNKLYIRIDLNYFKNKVYFYTRNAISKKDIKSTNVYMATLNEAQRVADSRGQLINSNIPSGEKKDEWQRAYAMKLESSDIDVINVGRNNLNGIRIYKPTVRYRLVAAVPKASIIEQDNGGEPECRVKIKLLEFQRTHLIEDLDSKTHMKVWWLIISIIFEIFTFTINSIITFSSIGGPVPIWLNILQFCFAIVDASMIAIIVGIIMHLDTVASVIAVILFCPFYAASKCQILQISIPCPCQICLQGEKYSPRKIWQIFHLGHDQEKQV